MTIFLAFQMNAGEPMFWIMIASIIIAVCFIVMAISLIAVAVIIARVIGIARQIQQKVDPLLERVTALSEQGKLIAAQGKEIAEQFTTMSGHLKSATGNISASTALIKDEVAELKLLVGQSAITAKEKVALVSQTIDRTNAQVISTTDYIQTKVVEPARELAAILVGIRRGLEVLLTPAPKQINRAYSDDEMFIG